ncbi:pentapeptide repeat-containing protein, partial [Candidatus Poribacteria bacterium]|nr:pentapeptide repeat-containing protein [Candidatus Poribacteria bacterium]
MSLSSSPPTRPGTSRDRISPSTAASWPVGMVGSWIPRGPDGDRNRPGVSVCSPHGLGLPYSDDQPRTHLLRGGMALALSEHVDVIQRGPAVWNEWRDARTEERPDLLGAKLRGVDLREARLAGADMVGADMRGSHLSRADLRGAHLADADMRGAKLRDANLEGATLTGAQLRGADMRGCKAADADVTAAD